MLPWLPRRRARIESIAAEAEALVRDLGEDAYNEARRREHEASSDEIARDWGFVALAVARHSGRQTKRRLSLPPRSTRSESNLSARRQIAVRHH